MRARSRQIGSKMLGGFAATFIVEPKMIKCSWLNGNFRGRAGLCLLGLMAALMIAPATALAAPHHARAHRVGAQTAGGGGHSSKARPGSKSHKNSAHKSATKSATQPAHPSTHHKRRRQVEADDDAIPLHRAAARGGKLPRRAAPQRTIAAQRMADEPQQPPVEQETSEPVVAMASAAPEPVTPAGQATLTETLNAAAEKAETAVKADASAAKDTLSRHPGAKASMLPDDHAGRAAVVEQAMTPLVLPTLYTRRGKLIVPPPMKGSWDILVHQNTMADSEGLDRIQDDDDLNRMRALHLLVPLESSARMVVNEELPLNRRYARPWTARFAVDTARAFYARFHQPLRLNSAVRTVAYQLELQRVNGNAAAVDGDGASPHLTGQAVDFGKRGMSIAEIAWMRAYLAPLMRAGKLDVEEEFQQACFHISVYRSYMPMMKPKAKGSPKMEVAQLRAEQPIVKTRAARVEDGLR
jgi:cell division protein FtsN